MATISRYDPFNDLVNDLFKGFLVRPVGVDSRANLAADGPRMSVEISERNGLYLVTAEIPGVRREDIEVTIDGAQVTLGAEVRREREATADERLLHSERSYGKSRRSFTLPQEVDEAQAEAKFRDGVLELTLPKKSAAARKQITIQ